MAEIKPLTAISYNYMCQGPESFLPNAHFGTERAGFGELVSSEGFRTVTSAVYRISSLLFISGGKIVSTKFQLFKTVAL